MEGVLGRPSILSRIAERIYSPTGEDGGTILVRRVNPSSYAAESHAKRQLSVGLEPIRWCPRATRDVRGRDDFGEGSSSRRIDDQARGVRIQNAVRRCRAECQGTVPQAARESETAGGERMHRGRISRSERKRIAVLPLSGSGRANGSGPARALTPNEGRGETTRKRAPRSPWPPPSLKALAKPSAARRCKWTS
jgi:hypothetical protein